MIWLVVAIFLIIAAFLIGAYCGSVFTSQMWIMVVEMLSIDKTAVFEALDKVKAQRWTKR